jgi:predicted secreted protein
MPLFLRLCAALLGLCTLGLNAQTPPAPAANTPLERARQAKTTAEVLQLLGVPNPEPGKRVLLEVPDIAVANRPFTVKVSSQIPGTDWILILSERDPTPLVKLEEFSPGQDRASSVELRLASTARVRAIVRSSGKYYQVSREVKVATPDGGRR